MQRVWFVYTFRWTFSKTHNKETIILLLDMVSLQLTVAFHLFPPPQIPASQLIIRVTKVFIIHVTTPYAIRYQQSQ